MLGSKKKTKKKNREILGFEDGEYFRTECNYRVFFGS